MRCTEKIFLSFGTVNAISLYYDGGDHEKAASVLDDIEAYMRDLDDKLSVFKPESEISALNRNAGKKAVRVSRDTAELLALCIDCGRLTDGAFDVTVKPLVDIWKDYIKTKNFPNCDIIKQYLMKTDYNCIMLNEDASEAFLRYPGQAVDAGGIAKGYAVDKIKDVLIRNGFDNALINLGGTVLSLGEKREIGIRNPFIPLNAGNADTPFAVITSRDEVIVTSGSYEQCVNNGGRLYHHIIDTTSGYPTETDVLSVTVVSSNGALADAAATACFGLGAERGAKMIKKINADALIVLNDGKVFVTDGLRDRVKLIKE